MNKTIRCAIYTRVSTTDNLEKEFTSLDSQRESAESYILSQKSEGWIALPDRYDDAGFTGANTERPALQKLTDDIKSGKVDCVVVYKVDRLSRSLLDFTQLLEFFDQNNITFVSVTQHFNTNTSMGRLTLNILLSFAQFEREIISERTRDKMGAARKKGKWIGGAIPIGYDLDYEHHRLVINPTEAQVVMEIFSLYLKEHSILRVAQALNDKGILTKQHTSPTGHTRGGLKFTTNSIARILSSPLYTGKVKYQGALYPGDHGAIITDDVFAKAQEILLANKPKQGPRPFNKKTGLLNGLLRCTACKSAMYITYSSKHRKKKYYYYICARAQKQGRKTCPTRSMNAFKIEEKVITFLSTIVKDTRLQGDSWDNLLLEEKIPILRSFVKQIYYDARNGNLELVLHNDKTHLFKVPITDLQNAPVPPKEITIQKEPQIRQNLLLAHQVQQLQDEGRAKNLKEVSDWLNMSQQRLNQIVNLLFLCPKIQDEIILSPAKLISLIPEYKLRKIIDETDWNMQYGMWQELLKHLSD